MVSVVIAAQHTVDVNAINIFLERIKINPLLIFL